MTGFIISSNYDVLYAHTVDANEHIRPLVITEDLDQISKDIIKDLTNTEEINSLSFVEDGGINISGTLRHLSIFNSRPLDRVLLPVLFDIPPKLNKRYESIDKLKGILVKQGAHFLSNYLLYNEISAYFIPFKGQNDILLDADPFEFLLIQMGLNRIDEIPWQRNNDIEYNSECWDRYLNNPRVEFYECNNIFT